MIVLMMGYPGSGKSHVARELVVQHLATYQFTQAAIVSADDYFTDDNGKYEYVPSGIGSAHQLCISRFQEYLRRFKTNDLIVVDNTNLTREDRRVYFENAGEHKVVILHVRCPIETAVARNVHGVPEDRIRKMAAILQPYDSILEPPAHLWEIDNDLQSQASHSS